jgi:hypothetical protein
MIISKPMLRLFMYRHSSSLSLATSEVSRMKHLDHEWKDADDGDRFYTWKPPERTIMN